MQSTSQRVKLELPDCLTASLMGAAAGARESSQSVKQPISQVVNQWRYGHLTIRLSDYLII